MKRHTGILLAGVTLLLIVLSCSRGPQVQEITDQVMGRDFLCRVYGAEDGDMATRTMQAFSAKAAELLQQVSSTGDSDFAGINALAGARSGSMTQENYDLLMRCFAYKKDTDEAFDFLIGPLRKAWGFEQGSPHVPVQAEIDTAVVLVREGGTFVVDKGVLLSREGMAIDLVDLSAGFVADQLTSTLRHKGLSNFHLRFGSVVSLGNAGPRGEYFEIPLADPADQSRPLGKFRLRNLSLAVADVSDGAFAEAGGSYHQHLDPRSGQPAHKVLAAAVVCRKGERADALSSGLFVLGADRGLEIASGLDGVEALFVLAAEGGSVVRMTAGMESWFSSTQ